MLPQYNNKHNKVLLCLTDTLEGSFKKFSNELSDAKNFKYSDLNAYAACPG